MHVVKSHRLERGQLENCRLRCVRQPCVRVLPRSARFGYTIHASQDSLDQQIQPFKIQRALQAAGHFAIAVSMGLTLTFGEVFANPLQGPSIDSDIAEVTSTLKEAWGKVGHIYYDTTFNNQDWDKVLELSLYEVEHSADVKAAYSVINKMLATLGDSYTRMLPPSRSLIYKEDTAGVVVHVGIRMRAEGQEPWRVSYVAPGSAAQAAGLQLGDTLISINGRPAAEVPPAEYSQLFRSDSDLRLSRESSDGPTTFDVHLPALPIEVYPVTSSMLKSPNLGKIGYVRLTSFGENTGRDAEDALRRLERKGASAFIVDLRGNSGGLVSAGYDVAHALLEEGQIFCIMRGRSSEDIVLEIQDQQDSMTAPLVVLVDRETASTSETLAGALQAQGRALLLGEPTFGKGRTQQITTLEDGSTLLITRNLIYTPAHALIDKVGLTPDLACKAPDSFKLSGRWGEEPLHAADAERKSKF